MSKRYFFTTNFNNNCFFEEIPVEFKFFTGFAITQKQKSINSMHEAIKKMDKRYIPLEISTKSEEPLGRMLSAFNLKYKSYTTNQEFPVENIFQSSKVFEFGGPFLDLLYLSPSEAKKSDKLTSSGKLVKFVFENVEWDILPQTMFYDWLYINALNQNKLLLKELVNFNAFTDIEFNDKKSINCQARAVAIAVSLYKKNMLDDYLQNKQLFASIYNNKFQTKQLNFFD